MGQQGRNFDRPFADTISGRYRRRPNDKTGTKKTPQRRGVPPVSIGGSMEIYSIHIWKSPANPKFQKGKSGPWFEAAPENFCARWVIFPPANYEILSEKIRLSSFLKLEFG